MISLGELAVWIDGEVVGDADFGIRGIRSLGGAGARDIAPFTDSRYGEQLTETRAGALLVAEVQSGFAGPQLVCREPAWALAKLIAGFHPEEPVVGGCHTSAVVDETAQVDPTASIGPHATLGANTRVGARVVVHAGVVIGAECEIGEGSVLYPRVVLYRGTQLGRDVVVHAGAVLGSDGFGYAVHEGQLVKVPQVGRLVVEDGVEIGANATIDRATLDETRIGASSKLDNLVQVGHNVRLGQGCILCGQVGLAGSTRLGQGVVMGGQSGAADHLEIGDGAQVAGASAVLQDVPAGQKVGGTPARELSAWKRSALLGSKLPELLRRLRALERRIDDQGVSEASSE